MRIPGRRRRRSLVLAAGAGAALLLYLALLVPASGPAVTAASARAGKPFVWNQDAVWSALEREFRQAREAGCAATGPRIAAALAALDAHLEAVESRPSPPDAAIFADLEGDLFASGALVAACPAHLSGLLERTGRIRVAVKRQSERWDVDSAVARETLYRLLYGSRAAVEEVMLQLPLPAVPALLRGTDEPSATPAANLLGVTVHSGDILVSRGGAPTSALIARGNDYPGNFSHVALLYVDPATAVPSVIEAHIERGVVVSTLAAYLADTKLRLMVLRPRADLPAVAADPRLPHEAASWALSRGRRRHIPYDFAMDARDHGAMFCSEVAAAAYEHLGVRLWMGMSRISSPGLRSWLAAFGVRHFVTEEPSDLEYDPQLRVVAEWRDPATLAADHLDNAVTEAMLEEAEAGARLSYDLALLPAARVAKAASSLLNLAGIQGPVPEGMSAEAALRNRALTRRHAAIVARLAVLAGGFRAREGYAPPYWELVRLARAARDGR